MKRIALENLRPGMLVARDVSDGKGGLLLRRGALLNNSYIRALEERGFAWIYVSDDESDAIIVEDIVASYMQHSGPSVLESVSKVLAEAAVGGNGDPLFETSLDVLHEQDVQDIQCVLSQVLSAEVVTALARMASTDTSFLSHALEVATVALSFAIRCGLDSGELAPLALGCLLHDLGKTMLAAHLFVLPMLSEEQVKEVQRHPLLGLQIMRELNIDNLQASSIVAQHHERQDGLGYPRGMRGDNRIGTPPQLGRISLAAEMSSIADAYVMLSGEVLVDSPLQPKQLVWALRRMAGTILNRQLVDCFLSRGRSIPVGLPVIVRSGRFAGHRGTVVRRSAIDRNAVVVRLSGGGAGGWMQSTELDTGEEPDANLVAVFP